MKEGGNMAMQGRLNTATHSLRNFSTFAALSQPKTMIRRSPLSLGTSFITAARKLDICKDGISMPLTYCSSPLNGLEEGHAPAQMPQLTHRSAPTTASSGKFKPSLRGLITTAS